MYQILTYPRDGYDETALSKELIYKLIRKHTQERSHLRDLKKYYLGEHDILNHTRRNQNAPNFKTVANHAKDIADTSTGYFMGNLSSITTPLRATLSLCLRLSMALK